MKKSVLISGDWNHYSQTSSSADCRGARHPAVTSAPVMKAVGMIIPMWNLRESVSDGLFYQKANNRRRTGSHSSLWKCFQLKWTCAHLASFRSNLSTGTSPRVQTRAVKMINWSEATSKRTRRVVGADAFGLVSPTFIQVSSRLKSSTTAQLQQSVKQTRQRRVHVHFCHFYVTEAAYDLFPLMFPLLWARTAAQQSLSMQHLSFPVINIFMLMSSSQSPVGFPWSTKLPWKTKLWNINSFLRFWVLFCWIASQTAVQQSVLQPILGLKVACSHHP